MNPVLFGNAWPGWSRNEDDHLLILLLQILAELGEPMRPDRIELALQPLVTVDRPKIRGLLERLVSADLVRTGDHRLAGDPEYALTGKGKEEYAALSARRANPGRRNVAARAALLDWLYEKAEQGQASPSIDDLASDVRSWYEAQPISNDTTAAASRYLRDHGLITGQGAWGYSGVLRPSITAAGIDCVEQFGGDIPAWINKKAGASMSVHTGGGDFINDSTNVQMVKNSPGAQQAQGGSTITADDTRQVGDLTAHLRSVLALPDVGDEQRQELLGLVEELEAAAQPGAEAGAVAQVWAKVEAGLHGAGPTLNYLMTNLVLPRILGEPPA